MILERAGDIIWIVGALMLVGGALLVRQRQMPRGRFWTMALIWIAVFVAAFGIAHLIDRGG